MLGDLVLQVLHLLTGSLLCCAADALDLYIATTGTVRIVDFNPICCTTSPLLFSWEELPYKYMKGDQASPEASSTGGEQQAGDTNPMKSDTSTACASSSSSMSSSGVLAMAVGSEGGKGEFVDVDGNARPSRSSEAAAAGGAIQSGVTALDDRSRVSDPGCSGSGRVEAAAAADSGGRGSSACGANEGVAPVIRVVENAGRVRPGTRVATGMPFDMLDMQDSVEEMFEKVKLASRAGNH